MKFINTHGIGSYHKLSITDMVLSDPIKGQLEYECDVFLKDHPNHVFSKNIKEYVDFDKVGITGHVRQAIMKDGNTCHQIYYIGIPMENEDDIDDSVERWLFLPERSALEFAIEADISHRNISDLVVTNGGHQLNTFDYIVILYNENHNRGKIAPLYRISTVLDNRNTLYPSSEMECDFITEDNLVTAVPPEHNYIIAAINKYESNNAIPKMTVGLLMQSDFYNSNRFRMMYVVNRVDGGMEVRYYIITLMKTETFGTFRDTGRLLVCNPLQFAKLKMIARYLYQDAVHFTIAQELYHNKITVLDMNHISAIVVIGNDTVKDVYPISVLY